MPDVVVIGAGAAGIIAAWRAATLGAKVVLLEKTNRLGTKVLISGGGKCNITHEGEIGDSLRGFLPNEAQFLRPSFYRFTNRQVVELLTDRGLRVYTRPDGRIFPVDQTAKDVVQILRSYLDEAGVEVRYDAGVTGIERSYEGFHIQAKDPITCAKVIVSVGGSSYPNSGTTGDGWAWARKLGHQVEKIRPALAPIYLNDPDATKSGLALRDGALRARSGGKEIARWQGDVLYTHQGISGPCALGVSRAVAESLPDAVTVTYDIDGSVTQETWSQTIAEWAKENPKKRLSTFLDDKIPDRLKAEIASASGASLETTGWEVSAKIRNRLAELLKAVPMGTVRLVPLEKGEVVAGGVSLAEVSPKTMESTIHPDLYWCGEVLDIAGPVGGYNLQAAFSTGYVAGDSAASSG